jgi:O-antigen/teichoic acid export membrane protein
MRRLVRYLIVLGLIIAIPAAAVATLLTPLAIQVVLGPGYEGAVTATRILIWSLPLIAIQVPLLAALGATGRAAETTKVYAAATVAALAMHFSLDWWWGATGGAVASLSREPIALFVLLVLVRNEGFFSRGKRPATDAIGNVPERAVL